MTRDTYFKERHLKERAAEKANHRHGRVTTPDGPGVVVGQEKRKNTNGGPGTNQYRVQLDDGRIRHYSPHVIVEVE